MKKIIHIALLIAGTSIGVGIVALPMVAVNLGLPLIFGLTGLMVFIGYRSFMMPVDVNIRHQSFLLLFIVIRFVDGLFFVPGGHDRYVLQRAFAYGYYALRNRIIGIGKSAK